MGHPTRSPWRCSAPLGTPPERRAAGEEAGAGSSQDLQRPSAGTGTGQPPWCPSARYPSARRKVCLPPLWPPSPGAGGSMGGQETMQPPANRPCGPARLSQPLSSVSDPLYRSPKGWGSPRHGLVWKGEEKGHPALSISCPFQSALIENDTAAAAPIRPPASSLPLLSPFHLLKSLLVADLNETVPPGRGFWVTWLVAPTLQMTSLPAGCILW